MSEESENLTQKELRVLSLLLDMIIPASADGKMPSATEIDFNGFICAGKQVAWVREGLITLMDEAQQKIGKEFIMADRSAQNDIVEDCRRRNFRWFATLTNMVIHCYYLNEKVIKAIGQEGRPPFPQGYLLEEGDLCLLESVYLRGPIFRS